MTLSTGDVLLLVGLAQGDSEITLEVEGVLLLTVGVSTDETTGEEE